MPQKKTILTYLEDISNMPDPLHLGYPILVTDEVYNLKIGLGGRGFPIRLSWRSGSYRDAPLNILKLNEDRGYTLTRYYHQKLKDRQDWKWFTFDFGNGVRIEGGIKE